MFDDKTEHENPLEKRGKMSENPSLFLPESQLLILKIVSALAWADQHLSAEETEILLEKFKANFPPEPDTLYTVAVFFEFGINSFQ